VIIWEYQRVTNGPIIHAFYTLIFAQRTYLMPEVISHGTSLFVRDMSIYRAYYYTHIPYMVTVLFFVNYHIGMW